MSTIIMMICSLCGKRGFSGTSCPDCGNEQVQEDPNPTAATKDQTVPEPVAAAGPALAPVPEPPAVMPDVDMVQVAGTVIAKVTLLPEADGSRKVTELRDGDVFTVADESSEEDPVYRISGDDTVSGKRIFVTAKSDGAEVTGGGSRGFALDFTIRFNNDQIVDLPKDVPALIALLQSVETGTLKGVFSTMALKPGANTRLPIKL